jgi:hypothetical protein
MDHQAVSWCMDDVHVPPRERRQGIEWANRVSAWSVVLHEHFRIDSTPLPGSTDKHFANTGTSARIVSPGLTMNRTFPSRQNVEMRIMRIYGVQSMP